MKQEFAFKENTEEYKGKKQDLFILFVDLEEGYGEVNKLDS